MHMRALAPLVMMLGVVLGETPSLAAYEAVPEVEPLTYARQAEIAGFPGFEFRMVNESDVQIVLGANVFTPQQLLNFVVGLPEFLEGSAGLTEGQTLVLRQVGLYGYVALAADYDEPMNRFTLTFYAEPPASVSNVAAVRGLGMNLVEMLLTRE